MAYKTHKWIRCTPNSAEQIKKKKQSTNIKCDEVNIMNIINDNTFNLHNKYMKVILKSKLIEVAR